MVKIEKAIAIIGPTTVGKTEVAYALGRKTGVGEVINLDRIFLYKHFAISSGLSDSIKEKGVPKHLYKLLEPDEELISPDEYIKVVQKVSAQILERDGLPIIEGGSSTYFAALCKNNERTRFCEPIIGLGIPEDFNMREKLMVRIDTAIKKGLIDEIRNGLKNYGNSRFMQEGVTPAPVIKYINGLINLEEAKEQMIVRALEYTDTQMKVFLSYPEVQWIEHNPDKPQSTVSKILKMIKNVEIPQEAFLSILKS